MKQIFARRPSPALVIACLALFVSLGGVSWGVATGFIDSREIRDNTIRTADLRNNEVRGKDIRNSTINGRDVGLNTLTGGDINESRLGTVPNADRLGGVPAGDLVTGFQVVRFSAKLGAGESRELATTGKVSVIAQCFDNVGGSDVARLVAATSTAQALMVGTDTHSDSTDPLTGATPVSDRKLASFERPNAATAAVANDTNTGFVMDPDGKAIHLSGDSTALGFDYAGAKCIVAGALTLTG